jgi:hypothetical protein
VSVQALGRRSNVVPEGVRPLGRPRDASRSLASSGRGRRRSSRGSAADDQRCADLGEPLQHRGLPVRRWGAGRRHGPHDGAADGLGRLRRRADDLHRSVASCWLQHHDEVTRIIDATASLAAEARARSSGRSICHADFHAWNVLVRPSGDFVVVDWDETLAPRERVLTFVDGGTGDLDGERSTFYAGYGDIETDVVLMAYYRCDWVLHADVVLEQGLRTEGSGTPDGSRSRWPLRGLVRARRRGRGSVRSHAGRRFLTDGR